MGWGGLGHGGRLRGGVLSIFFTHSRGRVSLLSPVVASLPTPPRTRDKSASTGPQRRRATMLVARGHHGQCVTRSVCHCLAPSSLFLDTGVRQTSAAAAAARLLPDRTEVSDRTAGERKERGARACVLVPVRASAYGCRTPDVNPPPPPPHCVCGSPLVRASCQGASASLPTPSPASPEHRAP